MQVHPDTHKAAIIWERRNDAVGAISADMVRRLSDNLRMGFDPMTAVVEAEAETHFAVQFARLERSLRA